MSWWQQQTVLLLVDLIHLRYLAKMSWQELVLSFSWMKCIIVTQTRFLFASSKSSIKACWSACLGLYFEVFVCVHNVSLRSLAPGHQILFYISSLEIYFRPATDSHLGVYVLDQSLCLQCFVHTLPSYHLILPRRSGFWWLFLQVAVLGRGCCARDIFIGPNVMHQALQSCCTEFEPVLFILLWEFLTVNCFISRLFYTLFLVYLYTIYFGDVSL